MSRKPTIPEVVDDFAEYLANNPVWGSLHIVLSDGNLRDQDVDFCLNCAVSTNDVEGALLARTLLTMSRTQRAKIADAAEKCLKQWGTGEPLV